GYLSADWHMGASMAATPSIGLQLACGTLDHRSRWSGGNLTRCHGSVSIWAPAGGGRSGEVRAGKVLKSRIFDPCLPVRRSTSAIMELRRAEVVVMKGTKKFGKPKCERWMDCSAMAKYAANFLAMEERSGSAASTGSVPQSASMPGKN